MMTVQSSLSTFALLFVVLVSASPQWIPGTPMAASPLFFPPALPPLTRNGKPLPPAPLLPPVPSQEWVDKLTKAQLSFIRSHQKIQQADKTDYNPYNCLPKYICIVEDEKGEKRTAIVNGLHPVLRKNHQQHEEDNEENRPYYQPGEGRFDSEGVPYFQGQDHDQKRGRSGLGADSESGSDESNESNEGPSFSREQAAYSNLRRIIKRPGVPHPPPPQRRHDVEDASYSYQPGSSANLIALVPWDDRPKNSSGNGVRIIKGLKSVLPPIPSIMPSLFRRRKASLATPPQPTRSMFNRIFHRSKRASSMAAPFITKLGPGIKSSDQCRILYNGCDLSYDQVMQVAEEGQVLIEGGEDDHVKRVQHRPRPSEDDDERDQAVKDKVKVSKPFVELLQSATKPEYLLPSSKNKGSYKVKAKKKNPYIPSKYGDAGSDWNKDTVSPQDQASEEDSSNVPSGSLPILPMRFTWGKPTVYVNGKAQKKPDLYGVDSRKPSSTPKPFSSTTPAPIFVAKPVFSKANKTTSESHVVMLNSTHGLSVTQPKPYAPKPYRTPVVDKDGNPASFASVFTEIAGSSGGIHDYFDKIARAVEGGKPMRHREQKEYKIVRKTKKKNPTKNSSNEDIEEVSEEEEEEEEEEDEKKPEEVSEEEEEENEEEPPVKSKAKVKVKATTAKPTKVTDKNKVVLEPVNDDEEPPEDIRENDDEEDKDAQNDAPDEEEEEDEVQDDVEEVPKRKPKPPKPSKNNKPSSKVPAKKPSSSNRPEYNPPFLGGDEENNEEESEEDSEEIRKRIKAAHEVQLPAFLPNSVKQAIKADIISGGKSKKKPQPPGAAEPLNDDHGNPMREEEEEEGSSGGSTLGNLFSSFFG